MIILLNGTSSSGKSSLAKALQNLLNEPHLWCGIDDFIFMLPKAYLNPPLWGQVFEYRWSEAPTPELLEIHPGPLGHRLISGMHQSIAALTRNGFSVIADHVLLAPEWLQDCLHTFANFDVLFVGVRCPLEVLEQRERTRRDRTLGQARAQIQAVHAHGPYDIEVDTSVLSPVECAQQIVDYLRNCPPPQAFRRLRSA